MKKSNSTPEGILPENQQEVSAKLFSKSQRQRDRISTSSKNLDDLLSGGLETGGITQFFGESNTGKTHLCHLLCTVLPVPYQAIYIDTEGKFRIEKIKCIAEAQGSDWSAALANIIVRQPIDCKQQEATIEEACLMVRSNPRIKLLIIDSMMFQYRAEYPGRRNLSERSHRLNISMHRLHSLAQTANMAVVITNQSTSDQHGDSTFKDPRPYGGSIISNTCTYIIHFKRKIFNNIDATLLKSPLRGYSSHYLTMVDFGFVDGVIHYIPPSTD